MVRKTGHTVEGINRRGLVVPVPETIVREMRQLAGDCLLDGEAVGDILYVFDVLECEWTDIRSLPYVDRLNRLAHLIPADFTAMQVVHTAWSAREKIALLERLRRENKEGIVLKNLTAAYSPGKTSGSSDHLKYKLYESASFVVTQVHPTKRSVSLGLSAVGQVVDAGNVTIPPNHDVPKPGVVVEARYLYAFRQSGSVYQPVYLGEREDIEPAECTVSQLKYRHEAPATIRV